MTSADLILKSLFDFGEELKEKRVFILPSRGSVLSRLCFDELVNLLAFFGSIFEVSIDRAVGIIRIEEGELGLRLARRKNLWNESCRVLFTYDAQKSVWFRWIDWMFNSTLYFLFPDFSRDTNPSFFSTVQIFGSNLGLAFSAVRK